MRKFIFNSLLIITGLLTLYFYFNDLYTTLNNVTNYNNNISNNDNNELEEYVISVVACEMPALYQSEALKAQAIAARTFYLYQKENNNNITASDQCTNSEEELKEKWGSDYNKYLTIITSSVNSTKSLVMLENNKLFKSFYFSTSNGYTEDSMSVFKEGNISSVSSEWDKTSKNYSVSIVKSKEELKKLLGNFNNITIKSRNNTNHVTEVLVDNKTYTGIEFRNLLNLRSTDFTITKSNNDYIITTYGYGHGVGMSQYGANEMAKMGYKYDEILKYYYGDIEIKKY